jgi:hypothetical protein
MPSPSVQQLSVFLNFVSRLRLQARVAAAAQELPPTPRQQMLAQQAAAASQQLPTVITRLPEQFNAQVR